MLFNEATSTFTDLRNIATVIAHEYAHQWFGNRVTAKWWSYIWLNEGFATLFEAYGTDWVFPEWKILDSFVYEEVQSVMVSDATPNTRPMTFYAESPNGIANLFDNVAYSKCKFFLHFCCTVGAIYSYLYFKLDVFCACSCTPSPRKPSSGD